MNQKIRNIKATRVFEKNYKARTRNVVNEGGARSSKTYSICQTMIMRACKETNCVFTIARKTFPALRSTVMRDFFEILESMELYDRKNHNKSDNTYKLNGNLFEFVSLDDPQKKRGGKRDYLWLNEANEFQYEDFQQLNMRTSKQVYFDYNPSEMWWIYDKIIPRSDCTFIHSTYLDAYEFLPQEIIDEIEYLKDNDPLYWKIYGLGEQAIPQNLVYPVWELYNNEPSGDVIYGLDFGYNNPTALVKLTINENNLYIEEIIYQSKLTNSDLIELLKEKITNKYSEIYADTAEPQRIEEIYRAGLNIFPSDKSVKDGIDCVKRAKSHIHKDSINIQREFKSYKYRQDKNGIIIDEPLKFNDHCPDAVRYAYYNYMKQRSSGGFNIRKWN